MSELVQNILINYGAMFGAVITFIVTGFKMLASLKKNCDDNNLTEVKNQITETEEAFQKILNQLALVEEQNAELKKQLSDTMTELTKIKK